MLEFFLPFLFCDGFKGGFLSPEDTGKFLLLQKNIPYFYPEQKV